MKKSVLILLTIALLIGAVMLLNKRKQEIVDTPRPIPMTIQVKVDSAVTEELQHTHPFLAQLSSTETAVISSKLSGHIKSVLVKENQTVKKGELLVQIDDQEIMAGIKTQQQNLKAQKIEVQYAKSLHARNRSLFNAGGLAREKLEASAAGLATNQAALGAIRQKIIELEVQLSYLNLKAPFDGLIGTIVLHEGSLASPGKPLLSINSQTQKLTFSYVPEKNAIKPGQAVFIKGKKIGQISNLYSDANKGLSVAEISPDESLPLPNNAYVTIDVLTFAQTGCKVPLNSLILTDKGAQIMSYEEEKFSAFAVDIVADNKTHALIQPCPSNPFALGAAAKLSSLPSRGEVLISGSANRGK